MPTGGPEDTFPPKVVEIESTPNMQTNFTGRSFELTFDEFIKLNDAFNQVVVSPPLEYPPEVSLKKGETVIFEFAKKEGLMFDEIEITHDECIAELFDKKNIRLKKSYIQLFLSSLSTGYFDWRSGLPVFAILQTFPKHDYKNSSSDLEAHNPPCAFCSDLEVTKENFNLFNKIRFKNGGLLFHNLKCYAFYLKEHSKLDVVEPSKEDINIFLTIMDLIVNAGENEKAKKEVESKIGRITSFRSNKEQRKVLLETLGYCSILETVTHKGSWTKFTNLGNAPRANINSDWEYPVDFWVGKDGINREAFEFWFGEYPELEKFWK